MQYFDYTVFIVFGNLPYFLFHSSILWETTFHSKVLYFLLQYIYLITLVASYFADSD